MKHTYLVFLLILTVKAQKTNVADSAAMPSNEEDLYADTEEVEPSQEISQPASTLLPFFEQKNKTVWVKELGQPLTLHCPVKNFDEKEQIHWYKELQNIAVDKSVMSDEYEVDAKKFRLTIKHYNDDISMRNFYCEVIPQKIRFHIIVKLGEGGPHVTPPPDQIQAVETTPANGSMRFEGMHVYYLVCLLMPAIKLLHTV